MTLLEYMSWKKWDEETAAQRFQTSIWTVRHMTRRSEPRKPGRELARRIVEATGGRSTTPTSSNRPPSYAKQGNAGIRYSPAAVK